MAELSQCRIVTCVIRCLYSPMIFCTLAVLLIDVLAPSISASNSDVAAVDVAFDWAVIALTLADNLTKCLVASK
jgi:hypothetical protein